MASFPELTISVVTVSFNDVLGLKRTVNSVVEQDYPRVEYIVIDGQSTDGTVDYLTTLPQSVAWISEADEGIADAFNKGIKMSTGDLLLFLNAGDTFVDRRTLSLVVAAIPDDVLAQASIVYGNFWTSDGPDRRLEVADHTRLTKTNALNHQSTFVGRSVFRRFTYDTRLFLGMDYDYWLRCMRAGIPFVKVNVPVARFELDGRSSNLDFRLHNELMRFFLRCINQGRVLGGADFLALVRIGAVTWWGAAWRRLISAKWRRMLKRRLGR